MYLKTRLATRLAGNMALSTEENSATKKHEHIKNKE
jgi:hypothetical protein